MLYSHERTSTWIGKYRTNIVICNGKRFRTNYPLRVRAFWDPPGLAGTVNALAMLQPPSSSFLSYRLQRYSGLLLFSRYRGTAHRSVSGPVKTQRSHMISINLGKSLFWATPISTRSEVNISLKRSTTSLKMDCIVYRRWNEFVLKVRR